MHLRIRLSLLAMGLTLAPVASAQVSIGLAGGRRPNTYRNVSRGLVVFPFADARFGRLRIDGIDAYWKISPSLDVALMPRTGGFDEDDDPALRGLRDRRWSADAGLRFMTLKKTWGTIVTAVHDVLGRHNGTEATGAVYVLAGRPSFHAAVSGGAVWQSEKLVDYYYGVDPAEELPGRPQYRGKSAIFPRLEVKTTAAVRPKWSVVVTLRADKLPDEIRDSPLVGRDLAVSGYAGVLYRLK